MKKPSPFPQPFYWRKKDFPDFKIWHFSLTLNLNIQWQKGKGVFQLLELGICVAASSAGHLWLWWCQAVVFWGCVHQRVLIQTAEGGSSLSRWAWWMRRGCAGQDVRWVYNAEKQSGDVCEEKKFTWLLRVGWCRRKAPSANQNKGKAILGSKGKLLLGY